MRWGSRKASCRRPRGGRGGGRHAHQRDPHLGRRPDRRGRGRAAVRVRGAPPGHHRRERDAGRDARLAEVALPAVRAGVRARQVEPPVPELRRVPVRDHRGARAPDRQHRHRRRVPARHSARRTEERTDVEIDLHAPILAKNERLRPRTVSSSTRTACSCSTCSRRPARARRRRSSPPSPRCATATEIAVIEGDIASKVDAEKIKAHGIPAVQINTGGACHLESDMIQRAVAVLDLDELDLSSSRTSATSCARRSSTWASTRRS